MNKIYYKHKTPNGSVRLFRHTLKLPGHWITLYHIGYSSGEYWLELVHNGRVVKKWRTHL